MTDLSFGTGSESPIQKVPETDAYVQVNTFANSLCIKSWAFGEREGARIRKDRQAWREASTELERTRNPLVLEIEYSWFACNGAVNPFTARGRRLFSKS